MTDADVGFAAQSRPRPSPDLPNLLIDGVERTLSIATDLDLSDQRNLDKKIPVRST